MKLHWTIGRKLIISFLSITFIFLLFGLLTRDTLDKIKIEGVLYHEIIDKKDLIADILPPPAYIIESYLCAMDVATAEKDQQAREKLLVRLKELSDGSGYYHERIDYWNKNIIDSETRSIFLQDSYKHATNFFNIALGEFSSAIKNNQMERAQEIFFRQLKPEYIEHRIAIDKVVEIANKNFVALEKRASAELHWRQLTMLIFFVFVVLLAFFLGIFISRNISNPIKAGVKILEIISQGDMTQVVPIELRKRGDEVGMMANSLNSMNTQLGVMIRDIVNGVHKLTSSSVDLAAVSKQLFYSAQDTAEKSGIVAASAEEMSTNIQSVSAATQQSSNNVNMIASSTEEMIATISEIAKNAETARVISEGAVKQAQLTSEKMVSLGDSAKNIGRVTETITEISEQTNLLALNATIEAARAGEAGKGFAVVANEIKELARQTAAATIDIKNQINEMQATTSITVEDIGEIAKVIVNINSVISSIAAAVEEQTAASSEIASNISQASLGIAEVNGNVGQSTVVISDIARDIASINQQANQVTNGSHQVELSAQELSELASQLEGLVGKFKV